MKKTAEAPLFDLLFQAARTQFRRGGYEAVSISKITHEVGLAKGTFFNYFPTKDHVLAEVYRRIVDEALTEVSTHGLTGSEAILAFCASLADGMSTDRRLSDAIVPRLSSLPNAPGEAGSVVRDEERIRSWLEGRLTEALPVSVPLVEMDPALLAFLLTWAVRGSLDEWARSGAADEALAPAILERVSFLLQSNGLPAGRKNG